MKNCLGSAGSPTEATYYYYSYYIFIYLSIYLFTYLFIFIFIFPALRAMWIGIRSVSVASVAHQ